MKIAHLSTYNCRCGISEYLELLVDALDRQGVDQVVFSNLLTDKSVIPGYVSVADRVEPVFPVFAPNYLEGCWWGLVESQLAKILTTERPDVLHVQLQTNLYDCAWLNNFLRIAHDHGVRVALTMHDSGVWPEFSWDVISGVAAHRADTMANVPLSPGRRQVLPRGIPARPVRLCSFAFGRNDHARVAAALTPLGIQFDTRDAMRDEWLSHTALIDWISGYDGVVLWYPDLAASVSSGALRTALAARRPVWCSDNSWFFEAEGPLVHKYVDFDAMIVSIPLYFADPMIDAFHFDKVAALHIAWYEGLIR